MIWIAKTKTRLFEIKGKKRRRRQTLKLDRSSVLTIQFIWTIHYFSISKKYSICIGYPGIKRAY